MTKSNKKKTEAASEVAPTPNETVTSETVVSETVTDATTLAGKKCEYCNYTGLLDSFTLCPRCLGTAIEQPQKSEVNG